MRAKAGIWTMLGSTAAAALILCGTAMTARAVSVDVGTASGAPGDIVEVTVSLTTGDAEVAGVQNDIVFDPALVDLEKVSDCTINADIGDRLVECDDDPPGAPCKQLQRNLADCPAAGCPPDSDGLKRFRGIILSTSNVNSIPDAVLYTCKFKITDGASGTAVLQNLNLGSSDGAGNALETAGADGSVEIAGGPVTGCEDEPLQPGQVRIRVGHVEGNPGETVQVPVTLDANGLEVAGTQNDIIFDPAIISAGSATVCVINPEIGDRLEACDEDPPGAPCKQLQRNLADCPAGAGCPPDSDGLKRFRGIILSTSNVNSIPDAVLYTCAFEISLLAPEGEHSLPNLNFGSSDGAGNALETVACDGSVTVLGAAVDTPTPTETATEAPPVVTPTNTSPPPPTNTSPPPPTNTRPPSTGKVDDDGCQVVAPAQGSTAWLLLIPAAGLLWFRRRSR